MEDYRDSVDSGLVDLLNITQKSVLSSTNEERGRKLDEYLKLYDRYLSAVKLDQSAFENNDKHLMDYNRLEFEKKKHEEEIRIRETEATNKLAAEIEKNMFECDKFEFEKQKYTEEKLYKESEDKIAKRDGWIKLGITTGVPIIVQSIWMALMWKFEEEGSITAQTSQGVFRNIFTFWKK